MTDDSSAIEPLSSTLVCIGRLVGLAIATAEADGAPDRPALRFPSSDAATFLRGSRLHRTGSLIAVAMSRCPGLELSAGITNGIVEQARRNASSALRQTVEVGRLLGLFAQGGIAVLTLKGVVLSQMLYGSLSARGAGDMDFLIAPEDFLPAHRLLHQAGYNYVASPQGEAMPRADLLPYHKDVAYTHPDGHVLELHLALWERAHPILTFKELWARRQQVEMPGYSASTLPRDILPVYLVAHGAQHCWERLSWLTDIQMLDLSSGNECRASCARHGLAHEYDLAVQLGRLMLGIAPAPRLPSRPLSLFLSLFYSGDRWIERPERGSRQWLAREVRMRLWRGSRIRGWKQRLHALKRIFTNPVDAADIPLPSWLGWAYPLLRPVGWVMRNFVKNRHAKHPPHP